MGMTSVNASTNSTIGRHFELAADDVEPALRWAAGSTAEHADWSRAFSGRLKHLVGTLLSRVPAVRDYKLALAEEAINRYDLDGLNWDFCRVPVLFQPDEVGRGTALITDLVRRLKTALARKSARVGRPLLFSARVP